MLTIVLLLAGVALLAGVLSFFGISEVVAILGTARADAVLAALALQIIMLALLAWRLQIIAKREGKVPFSSAFRITNAGMVLDFLTPIAKVGGEPVKILLLRKHFPTLNASAIVTLDTFAELISSLVAVVAIFLVFFSVIPSSLLSSFLIFIAVLIALIFVLARLVSSPDSMRRIIGWGVRKIGRKSLDKDYAALFYSAMKALMRDKRMLAKALGVSLGMKVLEFWRMWLAFFALGFIVPWDVIIIAWAIMLILFMIPWLPGSLGLIEFGVAAVFVLFGVPQTTAVGGVLIDRFISFWFVLIFGIIVTGSIARHALRDVRVKQ